MSNLIIISGPQAVGKMTVAEVLRDKIGEEESENDDNELVDYDEGYNNYHNINIDEEEGEGDEE